MSNSKSEIRRLDRVLHIATTRLEAVRRRDMDGLLPGEQARVAGNVGVIFAKATRYKSSPRAERGIETIWANAEARLLAEIGAAQTAKAEILHQDAKAKVAKKSSGWW
ncbi:hypothetical protein ACWGDE_24790 [Streptomyces sp. NPDC054956]